MRRLRELRRSVAAGFTKYTIHLTGLMCQSTGLMCQSTGLECQSTGLMCNKHNKEEPS